jgi:hypothetical protein
MPKYMNQFARPVHYDHDILDENDKKVGTLRVKPTSVLWKPAHARKFFNVSLDRFADWISDPATKARQTKS